jgi:hypothetical protein
MDLFHIHTLSEKQIDKIIEAAGGRRAHPDANRRTKPGADYVLEEALIELKGLEDEGLEKPERQQRLADLFRARELERPVIVVDRKNLDEGSQRAYDRVLERPVKRAVSSARRQLRQSRLEYGDGHATILFIVNNGYTALDHDALAQMVAHRVRNDTDEIDGIVVAGCYFHGDGFDGHLVWPIDYIQVNSEKPFKSYETLRTAWASFAETFMTDLVVGRMSGGMKGPIVDTEFDVDGVTFVKPAPPMGKSGYYRNGRPRKNTSGIEQCPPVALTFPEMTPQGFADFKKALRDRPQFQTFAKRQEERKEALRQGTKLVPFVPVPVQYEGWLSWCISHRREQSERSISEYANELFSYHVRALCDNARDVSYGGVVPSRFILAATEEIGQDRANDVSHIADIREFPSGRVQARMLVANARIFHEHAVALASAYAFIEDVNCVMWEKNRDSAWG